MPQLSSTVAVKSTTVVTSAQQLSAAYAIAVRGTLTPAVAVPTKHATNLVLLITNNGTASINAYLRNYALGGSHYHDTASVTVPAGATRPLLISVTTEFIGDWSEVIVTGTVAGTVKASLFARS
jgi:hypothetical protein